MKAGDQSGNRFHAKDDSRSRYSYVWDRNRSVSNFNAIFYGDGKEQQARKHADEMNKRERARKKADKDAKMESE